MTQGADRNGEPQVEVLIRAPGGPPWRQTLGESELRRFAAARGDAVAARLAAQLDRARAARAFAPGRARPWLMGIVNVTPDSFSDGGDHATNAAAIGRGRALADAGAAIVDVGGESTRPGAEAVTAKVEIGRVVPVIRALNDAGILVSIDSRKAAVMAAAVAAGAGLINDVSALRHDPESLAVARDSGVPVVLMHMRGEPATMMDRTDYDDVVLDVFDGLERRVAAAVAAGIGRDRLIIDPGIGFAKSAAQNLELLRRLSLYRGLGLPLLLGVSRKSFIGRIAGGAPAKDRLPGSIAAALWGVAEGADGLRVHDVAECAQAVTLWRAIAAGGPDLPRPGEV